MEPARISLVQEPMDIQTVTPDYRFEHNHAIDIKEATSMYRGLLGFIDTNEELIEAPDLIDRDSYIKGFKRALAITRLWIDLIYLKDKEETNETDMPKM